MRQRWRQVRLFVLGLIFLGVASVFLRPMSLERSLPCPFSNASQAPSGWQVDRSYRFSPAEGEDPSSRKRYLFTGNNASIQIEMRYAPDIRKMFTSDDALASLFVPSGFAPLDIQTHYIIDDAGNIQGNAKDVPSSFKPAQLRRESGAGSYCLWSDGRKAHLSAVMCPIGKSIVTRKEFSHQLYMEQFRLRRLLPGSPALFDSRSIIVDVSLTQDDLPEEETHRQLQEAWHDWSPWIRALF